MPLPTDEQAAWPPAYLDRVTERIASWAAWYGGDPDEIADTYGAANGYGFDSVSRARVANRTSQYRGGVVGRLARWFWGSPTPAGERRSKLHIPLAGDIAAKSSKLLFAEPPVFTIGKTAEKRTATPTQDRLNELIDDSVQVALLEAGEVCSGLGGVYLRIVWDPELRDRPWITAVHADAAVPEWRWDQLAAVTFWRVVEHSGQAVVRHLERHEPGLILHGLYQGTDRALGAQIPLSAHSDTAGIAATARPDELDGASVRIVTGAPKRLTAVYVPNKRPSRVWRNEPAGANLGRSDYQGVEPEMDALDEVWTSWMRDVRLGKGRAFVASSMLQGNGGPGQGASFDADREIYQQLNVLSDPKSSLDQQISLHQFEIRVEEHARTAEELITIITRSSGYSAQSFGLKGAEAITATEVDARNTDSFLTRGHKILYWRPELAEIVETLLMIDAVIFHTGVTPEKPDIEWPDGIAESAETVARTLQLLAAAEAISTQTKVEMAHPDWDADRVKDEVQRIHDDTGRSVEDPGTFRGAAGDQPPAGPGKPPQGDPGADPDTEEPPKE